MRIGAGAILAVVFAAATARADDEMVKVEVHGDANASFEQGTVDKVSQVSWKPLCITPCTIDVRSGALVRVTGDGFPSDPLKVERQNAILVARVPPVIKAEASTALVDIGAFLLATSAITLSIGAYLAVATVDYCPLSCTKPDRTPGDALVVTGVASAVVGGTMLGIGLALRESARAKLNVSTRGVSLMLAF